jgi:hypothetical protein
MERLFKVICLAISGRGNKMFKSGEIVRESQLNWPGDELVKRKEVELYVEGSVKDAPPTENPTPKEGGDAPAGDPLFIVMVNGEERKVYEEGDINKKEIIYALEKEMGVDVDSSKNKATLFAILLEKMTA